MADSRRYKTEKGMPLLPGVNRLERGYNFTVEVPEGKNASLVLYKKRSKKLCMEIPFTSENKAGEVYSLFLPDFLPEKSMLISPCGERTTRISSFLSRCSRQPVHIRTGIFFADAFAVMLLPPLSIFVIWN